MKIPATIFTVLILLLEAGAQKVQTIVPKQIIAGNAFQVQYIISEPSALVDITAPQLDHLRLISGPNHYKGNSMVKGKMQPIENISFTVVALKEGLVRIKGVTVDFKNGEYEKTDDIIVNVSPPPKASFNALSTYTDLSLYSPSSKADPDRLIRDNLFIKTEVSRRTCFLGEAIIATFKLYSRLQSTSEVLNAPSLYGFSVMDILNVNEAHQSVETINGRIFNTSVLRKLQLYPAQTGTLVIDAMQLKNEIEFEDSVSGKKIKVEKLLASNPVEISVKPLPAKETEGFAGAVGKFDIDARFQNSKITASQQGKLIVRITGKGNFLQFAAPTIAWPDKFDVFEPGVEDDINRNAVPTEGTREYAFVFTTERSGSFEVPPISFSFFDPVSASYKRVASDSLKLEVVPALQQQVMGQEKTGTGGTKNWILASSVALAGAVLLILFLKRKKSKPVPPAASVHPDPVQKLNDIVSAGLKRKEFCYEIQKLLNEISRTFRLSTEQEKEVKSLSSDCQLLIYSDITGDEKRQELQKRVVVLIGQLKR